LKQTSTPSLSDEDSGDFDEYSVRSSKVAKISIAENDSVNRKYDNSKKSLLAALAEIAYDMFEEELQTDVKEGQAVTEFNYYQSDTAYNGNTENSSNENNLNSSSSSSAYNSNSSSSYDSSGYTTTTATTTYDNPNDSSSNNYYTANDNNSEYATTTMESTVGDNNTGGSTKMETTSDVIGNHTDERSPFPVSPVSSSPSSSPSPPPTPLADSTLLDTATEFKGIYQPKFTYNHNNTKQSSQMDSLSLTTSLPYFYSNCISYPQQQQHFPTQYSQQGLILHSQHQQVASRTIPNNYVL